jgi:NAD(P)-dependent dehydrogenase (short-subunit alcohol dehydrogenase family)
MIERVVVITGATGATGKAAARLFAARGDSLVLLSRDQSSLDALAAELSLPDSRCLCLPVDIGDEAALQSAAHAVEQKFGAAHILIHLVGGWTGGKTLVESDPADLGLMLRQHAVTTLNLFQSFVPLLEKAGWGRVIAVSTPVASHPVPKRAAYAAGKAAQEALFLSLASELKDTGITANLVIVNSIDVNGSGKGASPAEIVAAMAYLCSDEAARISGARIPLY